MPGIRRRNTPDKKKRPPFGGRFFGLTREAGNLSAGSIVGRVGNLRDFRENLPSYRAGLIAHLAAHALRTDGPFTLRSGATSSWYLDARRTTFDGEGAALAARCVLAALHPGVTVVGGMTMGADPIAVATVVVGHLEGFALRAFSVRKEAKMHGAGGRLVGPVAGGDKAAVLEDTTTTGSALAEAIEVIRMAGLEVVQAISLADRSDGAASERMGALGVPYRALVHPRDLGVAG